MAKLINEAVKEAWTETALLPAVGFAASATPFRVFAEGAWFVAGASVPTLAFSLHRQPRSPGSVFWYLGPGVASAPHFFWKLNV